MIKNFQEFLNESEHRDVKFDGEDYTILNRKDAVPVTLLQDLYNALSKTRLDDNGKDLEAHFFKEDLMISLVHEPSTSYNDDDYDEDDEDLGIRFQYGWDEDNETWKGGYEADYKAGDHRGQAGNSGAMSPEEFLAALRNEGIVGESFYLSTLKMLTEKYKGSIAARKYGI